MPMSNNGFSKLVEETGELQQVAGKMLDYGLACDDHPDGGKPLVDRFIEESGDVIAAIYFIMQKYNLSSEDLNKRTSLKLNTFKAWDDKSCTAADDLPEFLKKQAD